MEKRAFSGSSRPLPDRNERYKPEDRCNASCRYSSDFRHKRQSLPPYRQRSSDFAGPMEILRRWTDNRYKRQGLTFAALKCGNCRSDSD